MSSLKCFCFVVFFDFVLFMLISGGQKRVLDFLELGTEVVVT